MRRLLAIAVLLAVAAPAWGQAKKLYDPTSRMQFYITVGPYDPNVVVGASPVIRLVKNGGADANSASTFTSGGGGYYSSSTLDSNDYNTPGPLSGWVVGYPWIHFTTWVGTPLDANIGNMQATLATTADVRAKDANLGGLQNELGSTGTTGVAYWLNNIQAIPNLLSLAIDNEGKVSVIGTDLIGTSTDAASRVANGAWGKGLLADANATRTRAALLATLANLVSAESNIVHHWDSNWATAGSGGGGTGLTAQQTRDALDLTATAGGASIDTQLAALAGSTGTGVNSVWPKVMDANGVALQGARITAKQGVTTISNLTDANGVGQGMSLDSLTFLWTVAKDGYSFTPASRAIPGDANFHLTAVAIAPPAADDQLTAVGFTAKGDGTREGGIVGEFQLVTPPSTAHGQYSHASVTVTSDAGGNYALPLMRTGAVYRFRRAN